MMGNGIQRTIHYLSQDLKMAQSDNGTSSHVKSGSKNSLPTRLASRLKINEVRKYQYVQLLTLIKEKWSMEAGQTDRYRFGIWGLTTSTDHNSCSRMLTLQTARSPALKCSETASNSQVDRWTTHSNFGTLESKERASTCGKTSWIYRRRPELQFHQMRRFFWLELRQERDMATDS